MSKLQPMSPLHIAARKGWFEICKRIIENVEDKNPGAWNDPQTTPLYLAKKYGRTKIARYIKAVLKN